MTITTDAPDEAVSGSNLPAEHDIALVPDQQLYTDYVSRTIAGTSDMDMLAYAHSSVSNVLIEGPTGAGKTSAFIAYAAKHRLPFYATPSSIGLEPSQLFGRYVPDEENGGYKWQDGPVTHLFRYGGVLLINEINFIPARVSTVLFPALDARRCIQLLDHHGEVIKAHPNLLIGADMNPAYKGTQQLNAALRNRFAIQQYWDYDATVEKKLVPFSELTKVATKLRADSENISTPVTTNMLMAFVRHVQEVGWDFAIDSFCTKFGPDERVAVQTIMGLTDEKIRSQILDIKPKNKKTAPQKKEWDEADYDLTIPGTKENPNPINFPDWEESWGIYLVNWNLEVEEVDA